MPRLTDVAIRSLPLPAAGQTTYDDEGSPLKLRISHGGAKTFIVMLASGRRHTIGRFGEVSLADARAAARRLRAQKTLGRILPQSTSVAEARKQYLDSLDVRPATYAYYERCLNRLTGTVQAVDAVELNRILDPLSKSARNQFLAAYRAFFSWCIRRYYLDINPCQRLTATKLAPRDRVLSHAELKAIWNACDDSSFGHIVRLLMLTGQRRTEVASIQSSWIGTDQTLTPVFLTFPASVTKNGQQHTVPLSASVIRLLLASQVPISPALSHAVRSALLFPSAKTGTMVTGWAKLKADLDKRCRVQNWTLHDLRRTFATRLAELGIQPHVIERCLNHITGTMTPLARTYNRATYFNDMKQAFAAYDAYITKLCCDEASEAKATLPLLGYDQVGIAGTTDRRPATLGA